MLLNFKMQFRSKIESGEKRHTIRAKRKNRLARKSVSPRVGEACHCFTGLRTKNAKVIGRWVCTKIQEISIVEAWPPCGKPWICVMIDGYSLSPDEKEQLAIADGFKNFPEMMKFWKGRLPFQGDMIHWDFERPIVYFLNRKHAK